MHVKVIDFGFDEKRCLNYIKYRVSGLEAERIHKLMEALKEDTKLEDDKLIITVYYDKKYYPFRSEEAKIRLEDFIAREEIEMMVFISSLLEDIE